MVGIDAGGTKLLAGVADEQLAVHHRLHRLWRGSELAWLDTGHAGAWVGAAEALRKASVRAMDRLA